MTIPPKFRIGCSGYYYISWKNKFYPSGLQPKNWLAYYSTVFNTVELNGTFYRQPKLSDLRKYGQSAVNDFKFSVKVNKYITHVLKLSDSKILIENFQDLILEGLGNKCSYFLFQLPPSYHYSEEHLHCLLENVPHQSSTVVEFRHPSWWNEEVERMLHAAGITFGNVDFPGLDTPFLQTNAHFYLRMHGNPELFKSVYSEQQLQEVYHQLPKQAQSFHVYFNNTMTDGAYTNARQMMGLVDQKLKYSMDSF